MTLHREYYYLCGGVINIATGNYSKGRSPHVPKSASEDGEADNVFVAPKTKAKARVDVKIAPEVEDTSTKLVF